MGNLNVLTENMLPMKRKEMELNWNGKNSVRQILFYAWLETKCIIKYDFMLLVL